MRNIGGSTGISMVTTMLARGAQAHQTILVAHLTPYDPMYQARLHPLQTGLAPRVGSVLARQQAVAVIYRQLVQQSTMLAFIDNFRWLALITAVCLAGVFVLKRITPQSPPVVH